MHAKIHLFRQVKYAFPCSSFHECHARLTTFCKQCLHQRSCKSDKWSSCWYVTDRWKHV